MLRLAAIGVVLTAILTSAGAGVRVVERSIHDARAAVQGSLVAPTRKRTLQLHPGSSLPAKAAVTKARRASRSVGRSSQPPVLFDDPLLESAWSLRLIDAPGAWRSTSGSRDVVVAVLDTGVDANHPDLQDALVPGWDVVEGDADPQDAHGHGTLVAGVIGARAGNAVGAAGVCPRCSIMPVRVFGADGTGSSPAIAEGIRWAVAHGARVLNLSFVLGGYDGDVAAAVHEAVASGVIVVAAAGNQGSRDPVYPAAEPGVLGVAATDEHDRPYEWSGQGPWVRVAAPGCTPSTAAGGGYGTFCGTSSATAVASGLAALALSARTSVPPAEAVAALETGAAPLAGVVAAGRLDAGRTVAALGADPGAGSPVALDAARIRDLLR